MVTRMSESTNQGKSETQILIDRAALGDQAAWGELLARYRDRLRRMIGLRLDRRLQGRADASHVIQQAMLQASRRRPDYRQNPAMPFFLWLRYLAGQRLIEQHRRHLGAHGRVMRAGRSRSTGERCPRRRRPRLRHSYWAGTPRPARRLCAQSERYG